MVSHHPSERSKAVYRTERPSHSVATSPASAVPPGQEQAEIGTFGAFPVPPGQEFYGMGTADVERIADRVYQLLCQDMRLERERGGW